MKERLASSKLGSGRQNVSSVMMKRRWRGFGKSLRTIWMNFEGKLKKRGKITRLQLSRWKRKMLFSGKNSKNTKRRALRNSGLCCSSSYSFFIISSCLNTVSQ
ncbi:hypothetical protein BLNAU_549 [Blattamonas nauphoetae]|uniref:Uncharacterized protein n=1 Tax=Blattamonas nauphoetae TaxID=2049346 RepID=A0ABQ9YLK7_9EUKA|nr:hypothetical protein BLNAU_549 [Blattamonas nauphoetae]